MKDAGGLPIKEEKQMFVGVLLVVAGFLLACGVAGLFVTKYAKQNAPAVNTNVERRK